MPRSPKRREPTQSRSRRAPGRIAALSAIVARNPALAGGATAFLVALSFVSANAIWYQPYAHHGAFFATRDFSASLPANPSEDAGTTILIERPEQRPVPPPPVQTDPRVQKVQSILKELGFYAGEVDGIAGPGTAKAITDYQARRGLKATGILDAGLLDQLGATPTTASVKPTPAPRKAIAPADDVPAAPANADQRLMRVQAGLKAFGNAGIEIDGRMGERTRAALKEFQAMFGLPPTGEPDNAVMAKMREIGLTN